MTSIEWCRNPDGSKGKSWNPIRARNIKTGRVGHYCEHVTEACRFCYAERLNLNARNLPFGGTGLPFKPGHLNDVEIYLDEAKLLEPLSWRKPQRVFVDSMDDPFGHWVKTEWLDKIFAVMALRRDHTFILLTKRPERAREYLSHSVSPFRRIHAEAAATVDAYETWGWIRNNRIAATPYNLYLQAPWPLPNVWLLVSCGDQADVDRFVPILLETPVALRGVSLEPLLGPIDAREYLRDFSRKHIGPEVFTTAAKYPYGLDWLIVGGESGGRDQAVRPMHPDWPRSLHDQCQAANVPFFFKQWGEWGFDPRTIDASGPTFFKFNDGTIVERYGKANNGHLLDGVAHQEWPVARSAGTVGSSTTGDQK
jgi:protein gp37